MNIITICNLFKDTQQNNKILTSHAINNKSDTYGSFVDNIIPNINDTKYKNNHLLPNSILS